MSSAAVTALLFETNFATPQGGVSYVPRRRYFPATYPLYSKRTRFSALRMHTPRRILSVGCKAQLKGTPVTTPPNPLLALFKEQLEAECASLAKKYGLEKRGDFLIY